MRRFICTLFIASTACIGVPNAYAQQADAFNTEKFCIYNDGLYSLGAMIEVGDVMLECRFVPATSEGVSAGAHWVRL